MRDLNTFFKKTCIKSRNITEKKSKIVYKKTEEWYIEWQRVVQRVTTSDNEWYNEWQRMTTSDNEWYNEWQRVVQRVTTSGTTNASKWCNEWKQMRVILGFRMKQLCSVKLPYIRQNLFENIKYNICRSSHRRCFIKVALSKFCNIHRKTPEDLQLY